MNITDDIQINEQVELCRRGDRRACHAIYQRFARPMFSSSMRILNNTADAEDMVQEAFVDAFRNISRFEQKSSFEAWLRRIVINKSISLLRKRKGIWFRDDVETIQDIHDESIDEEAYAFEVERIRDAVAQLPKNHQLVFNLFVLDGLKQEEIGKLLGISHANVRALYSRARKRILNALQTFLL